MAYAFVPTGLLALALGAARKAAATVVPVIARIAAALRNRAAVQRLADLDDRALKDIGLVRGDVTGALTVPLHVDPSAVLSDRRGARRAPLGPTLLTPTPRRSGHLPRVA